MGRVAYVNGRYVPHGWASVHIEDRGYQFADGVYEVIAIQDGRLIDEEPHLDRLGRSLDALAIRWPMSRAALRHVLREVIRRNRLSGRRCGPGAAYLQVTRGIAARNHAFPASADPVLVMTARAMPPFDPEAARRGVSVITLPDERWRRPDIKSISLLPNVLAKQAAVEAGAYEAWLVDDAGQVTEGTASNAWIVTADGELVTREADRSILSGITRATVMRLAREHGLRIGERRFAVGEAKAAAEAFVTGTTSWVKPVVRIDDVPVGSGRIGPLSDRLLAWYAEYVETGGRGAA